MFQLVQGDFETLHRGMHDSLYLKMGAHPDEQNGLKGTHFAVWAPNATEVSILCDRSDWTSGRIFLNSSDFGIWTAFCEGISAGDLYKFAIKTRDGQVLEKSDPFAFKTECRPKTASIVASLEEYRWQDDAWLKKRGETNDLEAPVAIYELHLASWKRPTDDRRYFNYRELAPMLVEYCQELGYTHLELMPITEHPFDGSWGYQTTGYFAPTARFGEPEDFMFFVDYCHRHNLGVIVDWVPAHFPKDGHSLGQFDGTHLYEHSDRRLGTHPDWDTLIFNYGRDEVRSFLLSSARFWMEKYHIDGYRVDAVASMLYLDYSRKEGEWVPNKHGGNENLEALQFLRDFNTLLHRDFPGILTIAEESTAWGGVSHPVHDGGLGFNMKWDMGWMNDTLHYMQREPVHRKHHQNDLSFRMIYAFTENFVLPLSHDEVVHGKRSLLSQMPGDQWQQFANLRLLYGYQYAMPGKKVLFMGGEFGQWDEWNHDAELDWTLLEFDNHSGLRRYVGDLNRVYRDHAALHTRDCSAEGFQWIQADDEHNSVFAFLRRGDSPEEVVVVLSNFTPVPREGYRVGVPKAGFYSELINSDAEIYGGSNTGNAGGIYSEATPSHGFEQSISLTLPPLSLLMLKPRT